MSRFLAVWTAVLLFVLVRYSSTRFPPIALVYALPALGTAALLVLRRQALRGFLKEHAVLFGAASALAVLACAAQLGAAEGFVQDFERVLPHPALLLALAPLAFAFSHDARLVRGWALVACAFALWQLLALPVEGVSGMRMGWFHTPLPERDAGPLHYQAAGLASQPYFFPGFMLPLFYFAWGWVWDRLDAVRHRWQRAALRLLLLAWVGAVACVQSRSALVAAALASAGLGLASLPPEHRRRALIALAVLLAGVALAYVALFSQNKSGPGLRWAYGQLYLRESFDGLRLLTGHGFSGYPPAAMKLPEYPISHSHNDLVQVLYSWGLAALVAYAVMLVEIVRRVVRLAREGIMWPAACLVALAPNMVTDLGVQHYEKAAFLVVLAALCIGQRPDGPAQVTGVS